MKKKIKSNKEQVLTYEDLTSRYQYCPVSGEFTNIKSGKRIGYVNPDGYRVIEIFVNNVLYKYYEHRLAWFYMNKEWPKDVLDHIDLDKSNNVYSNLREATFQQNMGNQSKRKNNSTGYKGVSLDGDRYRAKICVKGTRINLGSFKTALEAYDAYCTAAILYHGEFARF